MVAMVTPVRFLAFPARVSSRLRSRVAAPRFAHADWTTVRIVARPRRVGAVAVARATSTASELHPPARAFDLAAAVSASDKPNPAGSSFSWFTHVLVPAFAASALAVLTACVAGFLVVVREMVRACREATIASRAVSQCAESINSACAALEATLVKADKVLTTSTTSVPPPRPSSRRRPGGGRAPTKTLRPSEHRESNPRGGHHPAVRLAPFRFYHGRTHGRVGRRRAHRDGNASSRASARALVG